MILKFKFIDGYFTIYRSSIRNPLAYSRPKSLSSFVSYLSTSDPFYKRYKSLNIYSKLETRLKDYRYR